MRHIVFLLLFLAGLAATSCTRHVYVPVETTKSDTVYLNRVQLDSIYMRDSVFIEKSGDTIREFQYKYIYRFKDRIDTLYISKTDSIQVPYPVEVVQDSSMVLVGSRWSYLAALPLHREMDNKIERTGFLDII